MAPDTTTTFEIVGLLAVCVVVLASVYLLHRSRTRLRDAHLRRESTQSEDERAFNQIRITSAGADHLQREGYDVSPVREVLARAQEEDRQGHHAEAIRLVTGAREQLVAIRTGKFVPATAALPPTGRSTPYAGTTGRKPSASPTLASPMAFRPSSESLVLEEGPEMGSDPEPPRPKLPPHQVEARFALTELGRDLAKAGIPAEARRQGEESRREATEAYGRKQYSDAWRLALRGRRQVGMVIEGVGATSPPRPIPSANPASHPEPAPAPGCASCGAPMREDDRFCRACGAAIEPGPCPRCGASLDPGDRFCPACGGPAST